MPKPPFDELSDDDRVRFVEVALDEFSGRPYDLASLTHIGSVLGIEGGDVELYFDDKLDLFAWLVEQAGGAKVAWFGSLAMKEDGLFERLRAAYRHGLAFWREAPRWNRLMLRMLEPSQEPRLQALHKAQDAHAHAFLHNMLEDGRQHGDVRSDLDVDTAAWLIHGMLSDGLHRAFLARLGMDLDTFVDTAHTLPDDAMTHALDAADLAVDLLRQAVGARSSDK